MWSRVVALFDRVHRWELEITQTWGIQVDPTAIQGQRPVLAMRYLSRKLTEGRLLKTASQLIPKLLPGCQ
jgi:hypothetical protein